MNSKIIIGVSGGLDSTLSAIKLKQQGWDVAAVRLIMRDVKSAEDDARVEQLEKRFHIPVINVDCRERFQRCVIDPFIAGYKHGETPNPCVICNEALKIRALFEQAECLGATKVATGHYARIGRYRGRAALVRNSSRKDQTYMLCRLPQSWLDRLIFPLEDISSKQQVRDELFSLSFDGVLTAGESQDICFLANEGLDDFLKHHIPERDRVLGRMIDETGSDLGAHKGLIFYTEGQRKGLGISRGPWFVERRDFIDGKLHLTHGREHLRKKIFYDRAVWQQSISNAHDLHVQYCYRFPPVRAVLIDNEDNEKKGAVELDTPAGGVSLGQSIVFYDGDILLGGGVIVGTE